MNGRRHPDIFTRDDSAILLVDYQEKFLPVLYNNEETVKNIKLLLSGINIYKIPVFVSEQVPEKLGPTTNELKEYLKGAVFFSKRTMSCCEHKYFIDELHEKKIKTLALCGIEAHVCISQTALDLIHNGFKVHIAADAVTSRILSNKDIAIEKMRAAGVVISSVETILFEIAYEANSDEFKKLQQLLKG